MFKSTTLALLLASASALNLTPEGSIPADSKAGRGLMAKARQLNDNADDDMTWMAGYSLKYLGCSTLLQVREDVGEDESPLFAMNMVKFGLCPSDLSCSSCGKGKAQYVVNMLEFVEAYTEMKMDAQEQACENIRENCDCDNANDDDACESQCYVNVGMEECINYDGDEEFDAQEYLECKELEGADNNNNNNNNNNYNANNNNNNNKNNVDMWRQYFVGPVCNNGFDINLATFYDEGCSQTTGKGVFEAFNYGNELPFAKESMVSNDCIACKYVDQDNDDNNNNNNGDEDVEISELCEQSVEEAAKCESGLDGVKYYPDESGCDYINNVLPKLVSATKSIVKSRSNGTNYKSGTNKAAVGWAIFFGIATVLFSAYAFFLYRKINRAKVNLTSEGGTMA